MVTGAPRVAGSWIQRVSEQEGLWSLSVYLSQFTAMEIAAQRDKASDRPRSPTFQAWASAMTLHCLLCMEWSIEHEAVCMVLLVAVITNDIIRFRGKKRCISEGGIY